VLTLAEWRDVPGLRHGFLDRAESTAADTAGGKPVSGGGLPIATVRQVHGTRVVTAELDTEPPEADGVASARRGLAVGVVTADCVPALLLARRRGVVAAVHAGWRGAAAGVLEAALAHLHAQFGVEPTDVEAVLGPSIGSCCYRVGGEVQAAFTARTGARTAAAWAPAGDRLVLDLRVAERLLLEAAGVRSVAVVGPCTACSPELASYRRDGASAGRQIGFIGWA